MKHKPEVTASGFITAAGLRAGRGELFIRDADNWASLVLGAGDTIIVSHADGGVVESSTLSIACINAARKEFSRVVRSLCRKELVVLA